MIDSSDFVCQSSAALSSSFSSSLSLGGLQLRPRTIVTTTLILLLVGCIPLLKRKRDGEKSRKASPESDAEVTDPGLLRKHSVIKSFHVESTGFVYPSIRVYYREHLQADKLPSTPRPLPLLVFIHGLGGSAAQFAPLLTSLVNVGPSLCVDLPGCGLSEFAPTEWKAYTTHSLVELLATIIESYRDVENRQGVVLIGHSMGSSLAALLASEVQLKSLAGNVLGLVALCPKATAVPEKDVSKYRMLLNIPDFAFDIIRAFDRRGGLESKSVRRFVGTGAWQETKALQLRFNQQSKTAVWRRMTYGLLSDGPTMALPQPNVWANLQIPVLLIAGENDHVTPASEVQAISQAWESRWKETRIIQKEQTTRRPSLDLSDPINLPSGFSEDENKDLVVRPTRVLKTRILPHPASHSLLFSPSEHHTLSGLIQTFLSDHVDGRLSLGWQLLFLSSEGKWDVKNLKKWTAVEPVSDPIGGVFRAMKTMREVDETHCPKRFVQQWSDEIYAVVDISHESPVYDPAGLENGGVRYNKFPTVSKLPPTVDEVKNFNSLIDQMRNEEESERRLQEENREDNNVSVRTKSHSGKVIAVHCHYGFNRTGFFIVCYLIERMGWRLQDAIDEFQRARPPGIKHDYFVNTLFVRYTVGMKRAPTL